MCVQHAKMVNHNKQKQSNGILIDTGKKNQYLTNVLYPPAFNKNFNAQYQQEIRPNFTFSCSKKLPSTDTLQIPHTTLY